MALRGKDVLDVGSGSFLLPGYVDDEVAPEEISTSVRYVGVDPIPPFETPRFPLVVATGEQLPFRNDSFDAVVLATSLDHALDVEATLHEVGRVLRADGDVYVWAMLVEDEARFGADLGAGSFARTHGSGERPDDPVGEHLELRAAYADRVEAVEKNASTFESTLVDAYHFRHLDRASLLTALSRANLSLAEERTYSSELGGIHSFLRLAPGARPSPQGRLSSVRIAQREVTERAASVAERAPGVARVLVALTRLALVGSSLAHAAVSTRRRAAAGSRILMLTISSVEHDPRVNKVARTLADHGYEVDILAPTSGDREAERDIASGVRYVFVPRVWLWRLYLVYQEEFRRAGLDRRFDYVHANDLTTLTVGWVLARTSGRPADLRRARAVDRERAARRRGVGAHVERTRFVARLWERFLLRRVDLLVTVGPSIVRGVRAPRTARSGRPLLVPNYPVARAPRRPEPPLTSIRKQCGLTASTASSRSTWAASRPLRNIESVIEAHRQLPEHHVFVVMGPGLEDYGEQLASRGS